MSIWDDVGDFVSDAADVFVDVAEGVAGAIGDALEAVGDAVDEALEAASDAAGAAVADVLSTAGDLTADIGEAMLTAMDDVVFDTVDFATVGLIDIDYDEGVFGASVGIDDVFGASLTVSEDGFDLGYDAVVASFELAYAGEGFSTAASAGVDWGPLPYVEGHVSVDENGNVGVGGQVQAYLPTPAGLSGVELEGDYQETAEGFRVSGSATGGNYAYTGTYAKGGVHTSYEEDAQGYRFQVGAHGEVGQVGVGSITSSVDYVEGRRGDTSYEGVTVGAGADGFGASVEAEVSYTHLETPKGEIDIVEGAAVASAGGNTVAASGGVASGPEGTTAFGEVTHEVDELGLLTSATELAGDSLGVPGLADVGVPDVGAARSMVGDAAKSGLDDALAGSGVEGVAKDAVRTFDDALAGSGVEGVAKDAVRTFDDALAGSGVEGVAKDAVRTFDDALGGSGLEGVAKDAVRTAIEDASASVQNTVEESATKVFDDALDEVE